MTLNYYSTLGSFATPQNCATETPLSVSPPRSFHSCIFIHYTHTLPTFAHSPFTKPSSAIALQIMGFSHTPCVSSTILIVNIIRWTTFVRSSDYFVHGTPHSPRPPRHVCNTAVLLQLLRHLVASNPRNFVQFPTPCCLPPSQHNLEVHHFTHPLHPPFDNSVSPTTPLTVC